MITIKRNGKFIIPEGESFIGHVGDNLNVTKEFFIQELTDVSLIFRMYLEFDDGTVNYFLLPSETTSEGTRLTWNVTDEGIYKDGIVKLQIKGSNSSGTVFHSCVTSVLVQRSIEFGESFADKPNSEFLEHEQYLNSLVDIERENRAEAQRILGLIQQASQDIGDIQIGDLADGAITNEKIRIGTIALDKLQPRVQTAIQRGGTSVQFDDRTSVRIDTYAALNELMGDYTIFLTEFGGVFISTFGISAASPGIVFIIGNTRYIYLPGYGKSFKCALNASEVEEISLIEDGSVTNQKLAAESVTFDKIGSSAVATSGNSSIAYVFADDQTLPTAKLVKSWIQDVRNNVVRYADMSNVYTLNYSDLNSNCTSAGCLYLLKVAGTLASDMNLATSAGAIVTAMKLGVKLFLYAAEEGRIFYTTLPANSVTEIV